MSAGKHLSNLEVKIGRLADLPRDGLVADWIKAYGNPPPKSIKRGLLERDCAYWLQARALGGLKPATSKSLITIAQGKSIGAGPSQKSLNPGARLVRDWNGETHHVDVISDGYVWRGQRFKSLSAIARAITGARWSGPRFFGI
ncbi:MAG: DUF2924 domain-containing protein [Hyphomicrobiales bacterium]|nr:DUF2924 domain-containing protein [Hyphomicrobiales bacterium]